MANPTQATIKRLFNKSGEFCTYPKCDRPVVDRSTGTIMAEVCHINARSPSGPRYDPSQTDKERNAYENLNRYTSGPMYVVDGKGLGVSDLQSVLLVFDADRRLAALRMTMDVGGMGKLNFDRVLTHLKERYKATRIVNPPVGDKGAEFQTPGAQISIEAPHMSFQMTVAYMTKALFQQIKADVAEKGKKKADEGKRFLESV